MGEERGRTRRGREQEEGERGRREKGRRMEGKRKKKLTIRHTHSLSEDTSVHPYLPSAYYYLPSSCYCRAKNHVTTFKNFSPQIFNRVHSLLSLSKSCELNFHRLKFLITSRSSMYINFVAVIIKFFKS